MRALDAILAVVWAPRCAACDDPLDTPTRGVVCAPCWRRLPAIAAPVCDRCGVPVATGDTRADARCAECRRTGGPPTERRAVGWTRARCGPSSTRSSTTGGDRSHGPSRDACGKPAATGCAARTSRCRCRCTPSDSGGGDSIRLPISRRTSAYRSSGRCGARATPAGRSSCRVPHGWRRSEARSPSHAAAAGARPPRRSADAPSCSSTT